VWFPCGFRKTASAIEALLAAIGSAAVRRGSIVRLVAIGIVAGVVATLVAVLIKWLPTSASKEMDRITFVYWFATVICIAIFALVAAVTVYSVRTFRVQPDDDSDGPPIHGHTGLEIVWTIIPAVLVTAIAIVSAIVLARNGEAGTNPLRVNVFAQQFAWRFEYPQQGKIRSGQLVLPLGRGVELDIQAADVIHSFWVPQMGQKQDAVPGIHTSLVITPTRTGTFPVVCTELCGLGHATMRSSVRVVTPQQFAAWLRQQGARGGGGAGGGTGGGGAGGGEAGGAADGAKLFASEGCGGCHAFEPAGTDAQVGPSLDDLAAAAEEAGKPLDAFVRESIVDPNAVVAQGYQPGVMPQTFGESLSKEQIDALVAYLTGATQ
jgi:cytochrome c oxidase subunit 2